ncbi:Retrovirus-related Pol poly from transposon, partial [Brachionus plicatilis]
METESSDVFLAQSTALMDDTSKNLESEILSELRQVAAESFMDLKHNNTNLLYVIPENAVEEILRVGHCSLYSGHSGIKKTMKKILSRFYRPGLKAAIKNFIKTCDMCQRVKITQPNRLGELKRLEPKKFNHIVTIDMAGPFPKSNRGNVYILLSRAIPLPLSNAETIADAIISAWICLY